MTKKEELVRRIGNLDSKFFNDDQKNIAVEILRRSPENDVQSYFDFIIAKNAIGLKLDFPPEASMNRLIVLKEDKEKRVNVKEGVNEGENKLLIGNSYSALKSLIITHKEKIDIVYIDLYYKIEQSKINNNPLSKDENASSFPHKFKRNGWLNMIKERLVLAKNLLSPEGMIFISIDDSNHPYLRVLMNEIFEERNYIGDFVRKTKNVTCVNEMVNIDFTVCYAKDKEKVKLIGDIKTYDNYKNPDSDKRGKWTSGDPMKPYGNAKNQYEIIIPLNNEVIPPPANDGFWRWSKERFWKLYKEKRIVFNEKKNTRGFIFKRYKNEIQSSYGLVDAAEFNHDDYLDEVAEGELDVLQLSFRQAKPTTFIEKIVSFHPKQDSIVLDFFAESGTTGHAVLKLNKKDGGSRKFILVANNKNNIAHDFTYERLYRIRKGLSSNKLRQFNLGLKENQIFKTMKLRTINIDDSVSVSLEQDITDQFYQMCKSGLMLLDKSYSKSYLDLYYDLTSLSPLSTEKKDERSSFGKKTK